MKEKDRYIARFPDGMREAVRLLAQRRACSMNSCIVAAVRQLLINEGMWKNEEATQ